MIRDLTRQRLEELTTRYARLLLKEEDPQAVMKWHALRLLEEGLAIETVDIDMTPWQFAANVIENNPAMYDRVNEIEMIYQPAAIESADGILALLLPGESG